MSKNNKKETGLATIDIKNTPAILDKLDQALNALKKIEESPYKTSGSLDGFGDIKSETKIENLIRAFSMVMGKSEMYTKAQQELGLTKVPIFTIGGGNVDDWKQDILLRINIITHNAKYKKLKEAKEKMAKFLSEEDQKNMILKDLQDLLAE